MTETQSSRRPFDLEERTFAFAKKVRTFACDFPKQFTTVDDLKQLIRASGSVGANYIEANESLSKKDFLIRIKICRKESKECGYWLRLLECGNLNGLKDERDRLLTESTELMKIFGAIVRKSE